MKPFYYNGKPVPTNPDAVYKSVVHVDVPELLSSPKHFGHLAWKFCEFMALREGTNASHAGVTATDVRLFMSPLEGMVFRRNGRSEG